MSLPTKIFMVAQWWPLPSHRGDRCRLHIAGAYYNIEHARAESVRRNEEARAYETKDRPISLNYVISYKMRDAQPYDFKGEAI